MTQKTALITGAAVRIGREIALILAKSGYNIALHYHNSHEQAQQTAQEIRALGASCELFNYNMRNYHQSTELITQINNKMGKINLLVNSASIFEKCDFLNTTEDLFDRHMDINFKAPFFLSQAFAKQCDEGNIINLLDTYITQNNDQYCAYLLSKKSLHDLTLMSAKALAPNIRVNAICLGSILPSQDWSAQDIAQHTAKLPLQQKPTIQNITDSLLYLINSSYLTGQCIFVDSGQHL